MSNVASSNAIMHMNVVNSVVMFECIILPIAILKQTKKTYELNSDVQDTWEVMFPLANFIIGSNDKVIQDQCKVFTQI